MIIQGSNNPITLTFSEGIADIPTLVATLWAGMGSMIKRWDKADMDIDGEVVTLPLTEEETAQLGGGPIVLDVKGARALLTNGRTYTYQFVKWTT